MKLTRVCAFLLLTFLVPCAAFAQGSLNPPGPPAPTMKTLDQVEARVPIDAARLTSDENANFIIDQPGSYYLTGNLNVTKLQGIRVTAAGVTIDLNGFQIRSSTPPTNTGILIEVTADRCHVKNGSFSGFGFGINSTEAGDGSYAQGCSFTNLRFGACSITALSAGDGATIENCQAEGNPGNGFFAGLSSTIKNCAAVRNNGHGFTTLDGAVITGCSAASNGRRGIFTRLNATVSNCSAFGNRSDAGIQVGEGSTVTHCTSWGNVGAGYQIGQGTTMLSSIARENVSHGVITGVDCHVADSTFTTNTAGGILAGDRTNVTRCTANSNGAGSTGSGIAGSDHMTVRDCTAKRNRVNGIVVGGDSVVTGNHASLNGQGAAAAGIRTNGSGSRIDGNHARDNIGTGILADPNDVVVRNTAGNNSAANYNPAAGTNFGQIQAPSGSNNPMANVQF